MKIKALTPLNNGMTEEQADDLFRDVESFAAYSFNKSHSVAYTLISYQTMWLKVHYPAEFFAACLSIMDEDKLPGIVEDAQAFGIAVVPPDINKSTDVFEVGYDPAREQTVLIAPFSAIKGVSGNGSKAILEAREKCGGKFADYAQFDMAVEKRKCNSRVREAMEKCGVFASIDPSAKDARHPDRLKDQSELMPGLIIEVVKADRKIANDKHTQAKLIHCFNDMLEEVDAPEAQIIGRLGASAKFAIVFDAPNYWDEKEGKIMTGKAHDTLKDILKSRGIGMRDLYATSLMKIIKPEDGFTKEQIGFYTPYLKRELEILKPPVILILGSMACRALAPSVKKPSDMVGKTLFDPDMDATLVFGFNPSILHFRPEEQANLEAAIDKVLESIT